MKDIKLRIAKKEDAKEILDIYSYYVKETNITFEYEVPSIEDMQKRIETTLQNYPYIVACQDKRIVGYAYASRYASRKAYDWDCELSIYVSSSFQQNGLGKELYKYLLSLLKIMNVFNVYACITHPNQKSEAFHKKLGFRSVGIFHECGYKFGKWHDIVWMEKRLQNNDVYDFIPFSLLESTQIKNCECDSCVQVSDNMV